jgi:hypothetical protein
MGNNFSKLYKKPSHLVQQIYGVNPTTNTIRVDEKGAAELKALSKLTTVLPTKSVNGKHTHTTYKGIVFSSRELLS